MASVVVLDAWEGSLVRYEIGGEAVRKTHSAIVFEAEPPVTFTQKIVNDFRLMPPDEFSVDPPPRPTAPLAPMMRVAA